MGGGVIAVVAMLLTLGCAGALRSEGIAGPAAARPTPLPAAAASLPQARPALEESLLVCIVVLVDATPREEPYPAIPVRVAGPGGSTVAVMATAAEPALLLDELSGYLPGTAIFLVDMRIDQNGAD